MPCCVDPVPVRGRARHNGKDVCDSVVKAAQKAWDDAQKVPILTPARLKADRKADAATKKVDECRSSTGSGLGFPHEAKETLWRTDPRRRPLEVGIFFTPGADAADALVSMAKGYAPIGVEATEWRAEIVAGLVTLGVAGVPGYESMNLDMLKRYAQITLSKSDNKALLKIAGEKGDSDKDLEKAAKNMRTKVSKLGKDAERLAFGLRGILVLENTKLIRASKAAVVAGLAFVPVVGPIISAVGAAVESVKGAVAEGVAAQLALLVKNGQEGMQKQAQLNAQKASTAEEEHAAALAITGGKNMPPPGGVKKPVTLAPSTGTNAMTEGGSAPAAGGLFGLSSKTLLWGGVALGVIAAGAIILTRNKNDEELE